MIRRATALACACLLCACTGRTRDSASTSAVDSTAPVHQPAPSSSRAVVSGTAAASAIVVLVPAQNPPPAPRHVSPAILNQAGQTFIPSLLLVQTGEPVRFVNSDDELHNVNVKASESKAQAFNVAIPMGEAYTYTFTQDGFYDVTCDIHTAMAASIFVTTSPYATVADGDGRFSLSDVPPGPYRLAVYDAGKPTVRPIVVNAPRTDVTGG